MKRLALFLFIIVIVLATVGCSFAPALRNVLEPPVSPTAMPLTVYVDRVVTATPPPATPTPMPTPRPTEPPATVEVVVAPAESGADQYGLLQEESLLVGLYERVSPSVVHIRVAQRVDEEDLSPYLKDHPELPDEYYRGGFGSGFVWDDEGHIVTNQHVVADADIVEVRFLDGTILQAEVIGVDPQSDIAVIRVDPDQVQLRPVELGDSDDVKVGQWGIAIGNPFGQTWTMTRGIVSAIGRTIRGQTRFSIPEVIQTDASINPGNSGGPLLDSAGRVVGMNTMIVSKSGVSAGIGFAIPINTIKMAVPDLIETGRRAYAWLGVVGRSLIPQDVVAMDLPSRQGALVIEVAEESPADEAGLRGSEETLHIEGQDVPTGGDVIIAIDDAPIRDMDDLITYLVEKVRPKQEVTLTIIRDGKEVSVSVVLAERPSE